MRTPALAALWMAALTLAAAPCARAAPEHFSFSYTSGKYSSTVDLNQAGRYAVNNFPSDIPIQSATISGPREPENVGSLGGNSTQIRAINNLGQAIGTSTTAANVPHAFLYSSGRMQDLTAGYGLNGVNAFNDHGEIVGQTADARAYVFRNGSVNVFGPANSSAGAINARGDVLVEYFPPGQGSHTAIYRGGQLQDLPAFGGAQVVGAALNDEGWVAGYFVDGGGPVHAFRYDGANILSLAPAARTSTAYDINAFGDVVGAMDGRAFLFSDGKLIDLNTLIDPGADLLLTSAFAINDREQILATSCDRSGVFCYASVLLTPVPAVPEPPAALMWLAGLALAGMSRAGRRLLETQRRSSAQ